MNGMIIGGIVAAVVVLVVVIVLLKKKSTPAAAPKILATANASSSSSVSEPSGQEHLSSGSGIQQDHWLVGISGDASGKNFHLGTQTITIGRGANNYIQITDADASRIHCRVLAVGGSLQVQDMDSSNGIFVNQKKVKRHILQDQDELRIGECRFVYHRSGNFQQNAGRSKAVSTEILRPTARFDGEVINEVVVRALQESKGNVTKVANATNLSPEKVEEIGKKYGVL